MTPSEKPWICCQLGSREHYAIPRVLHREGLLSLLLTDYWAHRTSALQAWPLKGFRKLTERHHADLSSARVEDLGFGRLYFDLMAKRRKWSGWETTIRRNDWFQDRLLHRLRTRYLPELRRSPPGIFFAYSYAARELLAFFRDLGWTTVLGQIDPGIREENIVAEEVASHPDLLTSWTRAPSRYWERWKDEVDLSDWILVNSEWSRQALVSSGVDDSKIRIVPLAYDVDAPSVPDREYPNSFDDRRPLRVLFLGQVNLRKGLSILHETIRTMATDPVEFWIVGPAEISPPDSLRNSPKVRWTGAVPRSETERFYREADVFLLPTLSDGFALTQLEAQARRLPVLASRYCGEVVEDGRNGRIIDPLNAEELTKALRDLLLHPGKLATMANNSQVSSAFSLQSLRKNLLDVAATPPSIRTATS